MLPLSTKLKSVYSFTNPSKQFCYFFKSLKRFTNLNHRDADLQFRKHSSPTAIDVAQLKCKNKRSKLVPRVYKTKDSSVVTSAKMYRQGISDNDVYYGRDLQVDLDQGGLGFIMDEWISFVWRGFHPFLNMNGHLYVITSNSTHICIIVFIRLSVSFVWERYC